MAIYSNKKAFAIVISENGTVNAFYNDDEKPDCIIGKKIDASYMILKAKGYALADDHIGKTPQLKF